ncbi:MAG: hypothetical protein AMXMBFR56_26890 [Polyangiaceae bacterium]
MRSIFLAMVAVVGCESAVDAPAPPRAERQLGGADRTFKLTPMGIVPGQTNIPPSASMPFSYAGALDPSARGLIESQAYFVGPAGLKAGAQVVDLPTQRASDLPSLELQAVTPLAADAWHWLVVEQTAELRVAGAEKQLAWKAHFFTGSAPRVVRLEASTVKNPDIVNITFSEPVNAATLSAATLFVGGGASGACVLRGAACMDQSQPFLTNNVDLRLDAKFAAATAAVTLTGTVSGVGRSVAAAQGLTGDAYSGGAATLAVPASAWVACGDSTTHCWSDAKVSFTSP